MGVSARLSAEGLSIGYGSKTVAAGIALAAGPGDVLCLLGPNGSGKTTLFKTLLGLIPALGGTVRIGDAALSGLSRRAVAQRIAYVPQAHTAPFAFPVEEVVLMGRTAHLGLFTQPGAADRRIARAALDRLCIGDLAGADYTRLSGGQRQLVLIARALAQETGILVMDEPTASLDFGNQARVLAEVARLAAGGLTVVLSTHDPDHAFALGTGVVLLHAGGVLASGAPADVLTAERLSQVYRVPVAVECLPGGRRLAVPAMTGAPDHPGRPPPG